MQGELAACAKSTKTCFAPMDGRLLTHLVDSDVQDDCLGFPGSELDLPHTGLVHKSVFFDDSSKTEDLLVDVSDTSDTVRDVSAELGVCPFKELVR